MPYIWLIQWIGATLRHRNYENDIMIKTQSDLLLFIGPMKTNTPHETLTSLVYDNNATYSSMSNHAEQAQRYTSLLTHD